MTASLFNTLNQKILSNNFTVGIVGLGYVGLPLACEFVEGGVSVIGVDVSESKIASLSKGVSYIHDITNDRIQTCLATSRFQVTTDVAALSNVDVISICVPTPLQKTKDPDMRFILSAINGLADHLRNGQLIILESTTYPGTTDELIQPIIEKKGFVIGNTIFLAFSPERVDPGNTRYTIRNTPKIVGGITPHCTELACNTYHHAVDTTVPVSSARTAELTKLYENTFRSINIAMANEMALMAHKLGIDIWEVIDAATTKPFGFMPFYPGPGLGGHCIPVDPSYLSWKMKSLNYSARFIGLAEQINTSMPHHVVQRIAHALNSVKKSLNGSRILILGVAYKPNINDGRESPAHDIMTELANLGALLAYNDDYIPCLEWDTSYQSIPMDTLVWSNYDAVCIVTNHHYYRISEIVKNASIIVDTRNATKGLSSPTIFKL
jgi:UDP-N-acetyl-D-glucosamine dehydrogenase